MPLTKEFRLFFLNGQLLQVMHYWDEGNYADLKPDLSKFCNIAKKVKSFFFTMDIAKTDSDQWIIIELGDGQVSGLPYNVNLNEFYSKISQVKK